MSFAASNGFEITGMAVGGGVGVNGLHLSGREIVALREYFAYEDKKAGRPWEFAKPGEVWVIHIHY